MYLIVDHRVTHWGDFRRSSITCGHGWRFPN